MYCYALIDSTTLVCYELYESETPITDDPYCIEIDEYDESYILRKKYVDGVWLDAEPYESAKDDARYFSINGEWLDDKIYSLEDAIENHTHDGYASSDDLQLLEDVINTKASTDHVHSEYAEVNHVHDGYVSQTDFDTLVVNVNEKANVSHTHTEYSPLVHEHDNYANISHTHDDYATQTSLDTLSVEVNEKANVDHVHTDYALSSHEHSNYSDVNHNHDERYSLTTHAHDDYVMTDDFDVLKVEVDGKAEASHTHDYASISHTHTVSEIGAASSNHNHDSDYSDINHNHDNVYATITSLDELSEIVDEKANSSHSHSEYATVTAFNTLESKVEDKADLNHTHTASEVGASSIDHNHDLSYSNINHNHDGVYSEMGHDHDDDYATLDHVHSDYATIASLNEVSAIASGKANASHSHDDVYYTETEVDTLLSGKANASHTHNDIYYTETEINTKLADKSDVSHNHDADYDAIGSASNALTSAKDYTDAEVAELASVVSGKANTTDLSSHTNNTTIHVTSTNKSNWDAAKTHADSAHAPVNAEPNQNAFSNVVIGNTTISADQKTDTLTLVAGNNVTLTPDATGDSITISSANTVYTHPTTAGNKHIPVGGSSGQILRWSANGTAVWGNDNNTTYSEATQTVSGLMSGADKTKLDGIAEGANNYVLPSAGSSLGGVKSGGDVTISSGVITVNDDSHNHVISNIDGLQTALDGKASSGHNHDSIYYTETEVDTLLSGKANSSHTHAIANVTGLQSALDGKASTSHGTHVSYSTTAPVMDGTASVGTASTVARSDHKHPTDTTRASQVDLDTLETVVSGKANTSHTHTIANVTNLQATLDGKQATVTGGASTIASSNLTANRALISNGSGKVVVSAVTSTELGYLDGVTSAIQTQLDGKSSSSHTHKVANITDITATATELNYMDGVTSNVQTQLDGKASSNHNHGLLHTNLTKQLDNTTTDSGWSMLNDNYNGFLLKSLRSQANAPSWMQNNYASGIAFGGADTKGVISHAYGSPSVTFAGGNGTKPVWWIKTTGTSGTTYDLNNMPKADKATKDASGNTITSTYETKTDANAKLTQAKSYTDTVASGKANSSHTHNYAGSSSAGGAATSANKLNTNAGDSNTPVYFANGVPVACTSLDLNTTGSAAKLTTARNINLGNDFTGSASFNGAGDITISAKHYNCSVGSGNKSNYPYHRFAYRGSKASPVTGQYNDTDAIFLIRKTYNGGGYGVLKVSLRTNDSNSTSQASATWIARYNISLDDVKIGLCNVAGATYADLYLKVGTYARTVVSQLEGNRSWTLVSSNEVNDTTTSDKKTSTECYVTIENAATTLHGQAYTSITSSVDGGVVAESSKLGSSTVGSATQPIYLNGGKATACTYTLGKSVPSNAVFTDTTYSNATTSTAGLMSASDKSKLDGIANGANNYTYTLPSAGSSLGGVKSGGDVTISSGIITVNDDSHNHIISNIDGLQSALDGKSATSHTHTADNLIQWANALFATSSNGGVEYSYGSDSGKNVLTEISNMSAGLHTIYSIAGTTGNPKTTESWRMLVHKTSVTIGWILAFDAEGSIYSNYQSAAGTFKGWRCIYDVTPPILWMGEYWCTDTQTVTPSKPLSQCRNGWVLVWSDYDTTNEVSSNGDCFTTVIPKWNPNHVKWSGQSFIAAVPTNLSDSGTISFAGKRLYVHDTKITGNTVNDVSPSNDVCLRAIYEY